MSRYKWFFYHNKLCDYVSYEYRGFKFTVDADALIACDFCDLLLKLDLYDEQW